MQLQDFFDYKNKLMEDLLTNETIVHLVNSEVSMEDAGSLAYTQIFPYELTVQLAPSGMMVK